METRIKNRKNTPPAPGQPRPTRKQTRPTQWTHVMLGRTRAIREQARWPQIVTALVLAPIFAAYATETAAKGSFWPMGSATTWTSFLAMIVIMSVAISLAWYMTGRLTAAYLIVQIPAVALACASASKTAVQGIPLYPADLRLTFAIAGVMGVGNIEISPQIVVAVLSSLAVACALIALGLGRRVKRKGRLTAIAAASAFLVALTLFVPALRERAPRDGLKTAFIVGFLDAATPIYADSEVLADVIDMIAESPKPAKTFDSDAISPARLRGDARVGGTESEAAMAEAARNSAAAAGAEAGANKDAEEGAVAGMDEGAEEGAEANDAAGSAEAPAAGADSFSASGGAVVAEVDDGAMAGGSAADIYVSGSGFVGYGAERLDRELARLNARLASGDGPSRVGSVSPSAEKTSPDVIVILSESFWDFGSVRGVELSEYPAPTWRALAAEPGSVSGYALSRTYGGGTADVEFEVLTGAVARYLASSATAYDTLVNGPTLSLASIFKAHGYDTTAIHTYDKTFYGRDRVMPLLGFDAFIGQSDMKEPAYRGRYISDDYFMDQVIARLESSEDPQFVFGITMENHQPYLADRYESVYGDAAPIKALDDNMPPALREASESFLAGVRHSDNALKKLTDYLRKRERPAVLLFFGDHQPSLANDFQLYQYTGQMTDRSEITPEQSLAALSVPYLIWSNYASSSADAANVRLDYFGMNFLGNMLLNYVGVDKPLFFHYLDLTFEESFRYDNRELLHVDADGATLAERPEASDNAADMLALFCYDMYLGENYVGATLARLSP